ncbi:N-acetylmuramoyl-L-alanine amidase [Campylobacter sp. FMV-PI01]|uniref:N-acetylmuramoyl-L-alanine amidase n=1 Tax=Campylobacter portucalensis TaxID=2608384 RepID=A0A6L5WHV4_9BACT|nr:N-acetylmuramoyl-L-alanine amidase [Campylobacter portucalensis]MSN96486.1 N-acetylmuramoyl-L-alanine amidase [Campylobacter portucalensis]
MVKIARILLIFLFISSLFGGDFDKEFNDFDKNFNSVNLNKQKKFHQNLKNIYLKTSSQKDEMDRKKVLQRLIYSSKKLGLNYKGYENELNLLGVKQKNYKPLSSPKNTTLEKKESVKNKTNQSTSDKKNKNNALRLQKIEKIQDGLKLKFNIPLKNSDIKKFDIKDKNYRSVVDIKAKANLDFKSFSGHVIDNIRIAKFNDNTLRVVFENRVKFDMNLKFKDSEIYITAISLTKSSISKDIIKTKKATPKNNNVIKKNKKVSIKTVVIDPGHGGKDPGAMANGLKEKDIVLKISKKLGKILQERGYKVYFTRNSDEFINLKSRTAFANEKNADLFVSIHVNAGPKGKAALNLSGIETFFLSPARSKRSKDAAALENKGDLEDMNHFSKETYLNFLNREKIIAANKLAIDVQKHILNRVQTKYKVKDGGVREAPFWVLVGALMPAILIETGYITHPTDSVNLAKDDYLESLAIGIANGLDAYVLKN